MENINISEGTIDDLLKVIRGIPEFKVKFDRKYIQNQLRDKDKLLLIARDKSSPIGFTVGWIDKYNGWFKIWVSAVLPDYRRKGIMNELFKETEAWVSKKGIKRVMADVNQRNKEMIVFLLKQGFYISGYKSDGGYETSKVYFERKLS